MSWEDVKREMERERAAIKGCRRWTQDQGCPLHGELCRPAPRPVYRPTGRDGKSPHYSQEAVERGRRGED